MVTLRLVDAAAHGNCMPCYAPAGEDICTLYIVADLMSRLHRCSVGNSRCLRAGAVPDIFMMIGPAVVRWAYCLVATALRSGSLGPMTALNDFICRANHVLKCGFASVYVGIS